ncbi:MAG TPA: hypothetical protein VLX28_15125 [Thermoanaerobaculia bacterium]|nr:hypothetical protein [Thermoanaerobaculia bacterium]
MKAARAYEEVIDFIAAESPSKVIAFRPSEAARARVADLLDREKMDGLNADETAELDNYLQLEHIMRLAKARAKKFLAAE